MDPSQHLCPGSLAIRQPTPEDLKCRQCGSEVEIWSDELKAKCPNCGTLVTRDIPPSCIDWCKWAEECVGTEAYTRLKGQGS